jgi:hypothetical protein
LTCTLFTPLLLPFFSRCTVDTKQAGIDHHHLDRVTQARVDGLVDTFSAEIDLALGLTHEDRAIGLTHEQVDTGTGTSLSVEFKLSPKHTWLVISNLIGLVNNTRD